MKIKFRLSGFILIFICILMTMGVSASAKRIALDLKKTPIIYDGADVLTDYEEINISSALSEFAASDKYIYAVITTPDVNEYTAGHELEDIYNDHKDFFEAKGTILFLINTDESNPFCELQGYSDAALFIPHEICDYINKDLTDCIKGKEYYTAVEKLIDDLNKVRNNEITTESVTDIKQSSISYMITDKLPLMLLILFISLALSTAVTVFAAISGRKKTAAGGPKYTSAAACSGDDIYVRSVISHYGRD